jgi:hypothetical protein
MSILTSRRRLVAVAAVLTIAAGIVGGCGGYRAYRGKPRGFSTHPFRILYPGYFEHKPIPQLKRRMVVLALFFYDAPIDLKRPSLPPMILVRCYRMRDKDTVRTFMDWLYDERAARLLNIKLQRVDKGPSGGPEYLLSVKEPRQVMRLIPLPRERLVYSVETSCGPGYRRQFEDILRRVRESFTVLPVLK